MTIKEICLDLVATTLRIELETENDQTDITGIYKTNPGLRTILIVGLGLSDPSCWPSTFGELAKACEQADQNVSSAIQES